MSYFFFYATVNTCSVLGIVKLGIVKLIHVNHHLLASAHFIRRAGTRAKLGGGQWSWGTLYPGVF